MSINVVFTESTIRQNFNFSNPIISYICKNPLPTSEFLYKLYSTCKYFYPKMKIIPCRAMQILLHLNITLSSPLSNLFNNKGKHFYFMEFSKKKIYSLNFKLLCHKSNLSVCVKEKDDPKLIQHLLTKVFWHFSNSIFQLQGSSLTLNEFKIIAEASTRCLTISDVTISNHDGKMIPVEDLLDIGINIANFSFSSEKNHVHYYTSKTAQILSKMIRPKKFVHFQLKDLPQNFDAAAILTFIKNNADFEMSCIYFYFNENVQDEIVTTFNEFLKADLMKEKMIKNMKLNGVFVSNTEF